MSWLDTFSEIRSRDWSAAPAAERASTAREVVTVAAYTSAASAALPLPLVDLALMLPVHSAMVMTVGHVLGRPVTQAEARRVAVELGAVAGATLAGRAAVSALKKLALPLVGGVIAAPASFGITWGFGMLAIAYFEDTSRAPEELRRIFRQGVEDASSVFTREGFERWRASARSAAGVDPSPEPRDAPPGSAPTPDATEDAVQTPAPDGRPPSLRPRRRTL
jgi:uncharacterized protein (DUF697 family)